MENNTFRHIDSQLTEVLWKLGELVDVLACIAAVGNAESEVKVKVLEEAPLEIMPLDHTEAVNRTVPDCKLNAGV